MNPLLIAFELIISFILVTSLIFGFNVLYYIGPTINNNEVIDNVV